MKPYNISEHTFVLNLPQMLLFSGAVVSESCSCVDIGSVQQTVGLMQARLKRTDFETWVS